LHGTRSYFLQDKTGQIQLTHSVSAGIAITPLWARNTPGCHDQNAWNTPTSRRRGAGGVHETGGVEGIIPLWKAPRIAKS